MILVKCKCGCVYTLKNNQLNYPGEEIDEAHRCCPAYGERHRFNETSNVKNLFLTSNENFKLYILPDDKDIIAKAVSNMQCENRL